MLIKVICPKCNSEFLWKWGSNKCACPECGVVGIRKVKIAKGEVSKLFQ